ncbi:hypothetical protein BDN72DRAFT_841320 [Pluteus cervinus]|uniref:Uncharacterized protein n=1 Tax=Pluteus cervinus TaxID=181527 RepID=A0ACD3AV57_9AGAR|nr:hypothetical protein BDN72DRAFT_841320 [Pluteus cervinus]
MLNRHLLYGLALANCVAIGVRFWLWTTPREYSYVGQDYPLEYPMGELDIVAMTLQESVRFELNTNNPLLESEWGTITNYPKGWGRVHLGPDDRVFNVVFYHQLHCVRQLQRAILDRNNTIAPREHVGHCLNYLRQTFLCEANPSLEEGDFWERDYEVDRLGDTLVCKDWTKAYEELEKNFERWADKFEG